MGQLEILDELKRHPTKWFCAEDFADMFGIRKSNVSESFRKLVRWNLIDSKLKGMTVFVRCKK